MLFFTTTLNNVAAEYYICTIEDNDQHFILNSDDKLIVSFIQGLEPQWEYTSSNSSVLKLIDDYLWAPERMLPPGGSCLHNFTFEGAAKGTTTLKFVKLGSWSDIIYDVLFLNVTSNVNRAMNYVLVIVVFSVIIAVPSAIIIRRMKGEKKNDK